MARQGVRLPEGLQVDRQTFLEGLAEYGRQRQQQEQRQKDQGDGDQQPAHGSRFGDSLPGGMLCR